MTQTLIMVVQLLKWLVFMVRVLLHDRDYLRLIVKLIFVQPISQLVFRSGSKASPCCERDGLDSVFFFNLWVDKKISN